MFIKKYNLRFYYNILFIFNLKLFILNLFVITKLFLFLMKLELDLIYVI